MTAREAQALARWWDVQPPVLERVERLLALIACRLFNWTRGEDDDPVELERFLHRYRPPPAVLDEDEDDEAARRRGAAAANAIGSAAEAQRR